MKPLQFQHAELRCDVELYSRGDDLVVRFFRQAAEQEEAEICDLVIVDPGFGMICLKYKGQDALLSGFFDAAVFSEEATESAIEFVKQLSPRSDAAYIPHHVRRFKSVGYVEYNGEY